MTNKEYRVISTQKWDGKQAVRFFESEDEARDYARYLSKKGSRENVVVRDGNGVRVS